MNVGAAAAVSVGIGVVVAVAAVAMCLLKLRSKRSKHIGHVQALLDRDDGELAQCELASVDDVVRDSLRGVPSFATESIGSVEQLDVSV